MNFRDGLSIFLGLVIIVLVIYLLFYIKSESYSCISKPYSYPIILLENKNQANVSCSCSITDGLTTAFFIMNRSGLTSLPNSKEISNVSDYVPFDFSSINISQPQD